MRITDLLKACSIELNGTPGTKEETIREMVSLMVKAGNIADQDEYMEGVFAREEEGTTGIGRELPYPMQRMMLSALRGWRQWSLETAWIMILWTVNR